MYRETEIVRDDREIIPGEGAFGDLVINIGPQHPATHGVLHLVITLNGETIRKVIPSFLSFVPGIAQSCPHLFL